MFTLLLGAAAGIVLKILVPMPFLDDPVRNVYRRIKDKVLAWLDGNDNGVQ